MPALFVASLSPNQYFWQAFQFISDRQQVRIIGKQLANLANRLMSVHSVASGNLEKVNPVLKDRMYRIETKGYNTKDKINISKEYLIPKIREQVKFKKEEKRRRNAFSYLRNYLISH